LSGSVRLRTVCIFIQWLPADCYIHRNQVAGVDEPLWRLHTGAETNLQPLSLFSALSEDGASPQNNRDYQIGPEAADVRFESVRGVTSCGSHFQCNWVADSVSCIDAARFLPA
jgi:hypothetical protein